ncbi:cystathionine beta-lyase family protein involved in aluminum resistance [Virgibacillus natechei]|uniref:Cystathionine beta-lyase family protein involved in aluminum resistance n=1 Tax=Virgibacillus natechei TaxID=1216297 RepID=A0ABS4IAX2_9BACI|nr:methionine gamma-lyase family protein [Virgibacillus natechei]MBP1968018.1 cystathionine beta-lyase family protein involved in aluminum resistance [Virgibacillus natechei]UZD14699.1 methionine gamma-lyase family protein [Virgibacillus natechei]
MIDHMIKQAEEDCDIEYKKINSIVEKNQKRVLDAFKKNRISDGHFSSTTGYGYDDLGREGLEAVYADVFGGEDSLVRPQLVSGTHAISTALFGLLRPGNELLYITGKPYDTLEEVIGKRGDNTGSLMDFNITYNEVNLNENGTVDFEAVKHHISNQTKVIGIQRSKGYDERPSFTIAEIEKMVRFIKNLNEDLIVFVDNCYGEFVEEKEPLHVGADIIAGSLIKNPGGGIVRAGGYIAGNEELVFQCANHLTAPGLGKETGATLNMLQEMYQGFFLAPHIVGEALKGAVFTARFLELNGYLTVPHYQAKRTDLIQSVTFKQPDQMIAFCQAIQQNSPINSYVTPYPSAMPGYEDEVIMAAGTFIQGASIELSADGPIREPYTAFVQGGLTYAHVKLALIESVKVLERNNR